MPAARTERPIDPRALMRAALIQARQLRLIPVVVDALPKQTPEVQREILKAALPRFIQLMKTNGADHIGPLSGEDAIDELSDEKIAPCLPRSAIRNEGEVAVAIGVL